MDVLRTWMLEGTVNGDAVSATWWGRITSHGHEQLEEADSKYLAFLDSTLVFSTCRRRCYLPLIISYDIVSTNGGKYMAESSLDDHQERVAVDVKIECHVDEQQFSSRDRC